MIVRASATKDHFKLHFVDGASAAYPLSCLRQRLRFYRRMAHLHSHPSYASIAIALEELLESLEAEGLLRRGR